MRKSLVLALVFVLGFAALDTSQAQRRKARISAEHYSFSAPRLEEKLAPYRGMYDRVTVLDRSETKILEGWAICKIRWEGRRVDAILNADQTSLEFEIDVPTGATVSAVTLYLIAANAKKSLKVEEPVHTVRGDSLLLVPVEDTQGFELVEVDYVFVGEGVSVDEGFLFQREWPLLDGQYTFSVARDLWQDAADQGLVWDFSATTHPRTWEPTRKDTPDLFTWYWRKTGSEPMKKGGLFTTPQSVEVMGYLPAPALASFDPENLPDIASRKDLLELEHLLRDHYDREAPATRSGGVGTGTRGDSPTKSDMDFLDSPGKGPR